MDYLLERDFLASPVVDVAVLCTNLNGGKYLPDLIDSIHQSTVKPSVMLIVDQGSDDNSFEVFETYAHLDYLKVISTTRPLTRARALNLALDQISQKYVLLLNSEDYVDHSRLEKQFEYLEKHPEVQVVGSNVTYFENGTGKLINHSNFPIGADYIARRYERGENGVMPGSVMIRREILMKFRYNDELSNSIHYDLFARMIKKRHQIQNLRESLTYVRLNKENTSVFMTFQVIETNFLLRDRIFGTHTGKFHLYTYFIHLHYYRKYLFEPDSLLRYGFLFLSILFQPTKLLRRFTGWQWLPEKEKFRSEVEA